MHFENYLYTFAKWILLLPFLLLFTMSELYSYHIFVFPFRVKSGQVEVVKIANDFGEFVKRPLDSEKITKELYNEITYFYPFVGDSLYGKEDNSNYFEHWELEKKYQPFKYVIGVKNEMYELEVESIMIDYFPGQKVGTLSFHLANRNENQKKVSTILNINQYGRRMYPPSFQYKKEISNPNFSEAIAKINLECYKTTATFNEIPDFIALVGDEYEKTESFYSYTYPSIVGEVCREKYHLPNHITCFFEEKITLDAIIDDRMFALCWYGNTNWANQLNKLVPKQRHFAIKDYAYTKDEDWAKFVFVDNAGFLTFQDALNHAEKIKSHTYTRWINFNTLFGITRYSFVLLTVDFDVLPAPFLVEHLRSIYYKMASLVLLQRAFIQHFSDRVTDVAQKLDEADKSNLAKEIQSLYKDYILFRNRIHFREITAQEQGIELYDMLTKEMRIEQQVKDLDNEIEELHTFTSLLEDEKRNAALETISKFGVPIATMSLFISFLSLSPFGDLLKCPLYFLTLILCVFAFSYGIFVWINKKNNTSEQNLTDAIRSVVLVLLFFILLLVMMKETFICNLCG